MRDANPYLTVIKALHDMRPWDDYNPEPELHFSDEKFCDQFTERLEENTTLIVEYACGCSYTVPLDFPKRCPDAGCYAPWMFTRR